MKPKRPSMKQDSHPAHRMPPSAHNGTILNFKGSPLLTKDPSNINSPLPAAIQAQSQIPGDPDDPANLYRQMQ